MSILIYMFNVYLSQVKVRKKGGDMPSEIYVQQTSLKWTPCPILLFPYLLYLTMGNLLKKHRHKNLALCSLKLSSGYLELFLYGCVIKMHQMSFLEKRKQKQTNKVSLSDLKNSWKATSRFIFERVISNFTRRYF